MQQTPKDKAENDIRVGMNSRPRNVIRYASSIMKEKNLKELKFSAVGGFFILFCNLRLSALALSPHSSCQMLF